MPRATAPRPTALAAAPPVLWAGPEVVADAAPEARDAAELAMDAADDLAEAIAELAAEAAPVIIDLEADMDMDAAEVAAAEAGTETEIPAALQRPASAGATSVGQLVLVFQIDVGAGNILARSSDEHLLGRQDSSDLVIADWPVVHWQVTSVTPQPDPGMADTRQGIFVALVQETPN
jgi:hypothetical protein